MSADSTFASTITATSDSTDSNDVMAGDELAIVSSDGGGLKISVGSKSLRGNNNILFTAMVATGCPGMTEGGGECKAPNVCDNTSFDPKWKSVGGKCVRPCQAWNIYCRSSYDGTPFCACPAGQICNTMCQNP